MDPFSLFCDEDPSWDRFQNDVAQYIFRVCSTCEQMGPITLTGHDEALKYFNSVVEKARKLKARKPKATKGEIAETCSNMLVRLPNMVLENTVVDVYDFSSLNERDGISCFATDDIAKRLTYMNAQKSDKFGFILGRIPTAEDFPDCGIRLSGQECKFVHNEVERCFKPENLCCEQRRDLLKYPNLPVFPTSSKQPLPLLANALPKDRNSCFRVACVISLQKFNLQFGHPRHRTVTNPKFVQECAESLKSFLDATPGRRVVFAAVTNFHECFFVALLALEAAQGAPVKFLYYPYYSGVVIGRDAVARELAKFCATDPLALGLNPALFHSPHLTVEACLSRGNEELMMQARWQGDRIALNVSMSKNALELERYILKYLEVKEVMYVPRIHRAAQDDLYQRYNESSTAFQAPAGLSCVQQFGITKEQILQVWTILKSLHAVGIVHRDVRAENFMQDESGNMHLTNLHAAQFYNPALAGVDLHETLGRPLNELVPLYNSRNTNTASAAVLRDNLPTLPADEACAIIYATLQESLPYCSVNLPLFQCSNLKAKSRDWWHRQYRKYTSPAMEEDVHIIQKSLAELEKHRADPAYTVEQMDAAVQVAVEAVYHFKDAFNAVLAANPDDDYIERQKRWRSWPC